MQIEANQAEMKQQIEEIKKNHVTVMKRLDSLQIMFQKILQKLDGKSNTSRGRSRNHSANRQQQARVIYSDSNTSKFNGAVNNTSSSSSSSYHNDD